MKKSLNIIENLALKLRTILFDKFPDISDSRKLVDYAVSWLGGQVIGADDSRYEETLGKLYVKKPGEFLIKVSLYTSPLRDTFEIAKEVGRYLLLYKDKMGEKSFFFENTNTEAIINLFASAFLMPKKEVKKAKKTYKNNISLIAAHFQIPTDIVSARLDYLR